MCSDDDLSRCTWIQASDDISSTRWDPARLDLHVEFFTLAAAQVLSDRITTVQAGDIEIAIHDQRIGG